MYVKENGVWRVNYIGRDYLGSITYITDKDGKLKQELSYDAWGRLRKPDNQVVYTLGEEPELTLGRGYTGHEHLPMFGPVNMNARLYDPVVGRFLSPDPYVQAPWMTRNFNRYSYALNNPLRYTDESGEFFFSILAAIFCPPLLPAAIGADIGWISGGIRGSMTPGMNFWDGAWRGGVGGAVGGGLSMFGGGGFLVNVAWGMGEGVVTGGPDTALWGKNIGKGMLNGAAIGGAFAATTSGIEAYGNYKNGHGFRTDEDVVKNYIKNSRYQDAIDYVQVKYGMSLNAQGQNVSMTYNGNIADYGVTDPYTGNIEIGPAAFRSSSEFKATIVHEYAHSTIDRVLDANGNFTGWAYPQGSFLSTSQTLVTDGPLGYANEIFNAGKLHINTRYLAPNYNPLWSEWNKEFKWLYTAPRRYHSSVNMRFY